MPYRRSEEKEGVPANAPPACRVTAPMTLNRIARSSKKGDSTIASPSPHSARQRLGTLPLDRGAFLVLAAPVQKTKIQGRSRAPHSHRPFAPRVRHHLLQMASALLLIA